MDKFLEFLTTNTSIAILFIVCIMIIFLTLIGAILLLILKGKFKAKIAGQEFAVNADDGKSKKTETTEPQKVIEAASSVTHQLDMKNLSFINMLTVIIESSVESGYKRSVKRQELFDVQIKNAKSRLNFVITQILNDYIKAYPKGNFNTVQIVLADIFDRVIINELEAIFRQDKLAEKSKEQILEINRSFINSSASTLLLEIGKFINNRTQVNFDNSLYEIIYKYSDEIKAAVTSGLEDAYRDSLLFLNDVVKIKEEFTSTITSILTSYDPGIQKRENFPKSWNDSMPPNSIVGSA